MILECASSFLFSPVGEPPVGGNVERLSEKIHDDNKDGAEETASHPEVSHIHAGSHGANLTMLLLLRLCTKLRLKHKYICRQPPEKYFYGAPG